MARERPHLIPVKFTKSTGNYSVGEIAGFPADVVQRLIDQGVAEKFKKEKAPKETKLRNRPVSEDKQALADRDTDYVTK